jgi:YjbE family integral membrane protein
MGAVGLRIVFIAVISVLLRIPLLQAAGGAILLWIAVKLLSQEGHGGEEHETVRQGTTLLEAIWIIVLADVIMSLDNVLAISGAAHGDMVLVVFGVGLSIPLVIWGSGLLARLMARFWWIVDVGAAILGWVAGEMILGDRVVQGWIGGHPSAVATRAVQVALAVVVVLIGRAWARRRGRAVVAVRAGSGH